MTGYFLPTGALVPFEIIFAHPPLKDEAQIASFKEPVHTAQ
jgi:hypothetical protein